MIKRKKSIILEDLFFKSNVESVGDVLKEMRKYDEIIFQQMNYDVRIDSRSLEEYVSRYDTYVDAGYIFRFNPIYNATLIYHVIIEYIQREAEYQRHHPYGLYKKEWDDRYDRMQLNINPIIEIVKYFE